MCSSWWTGKESFASFEGSSTLASSSTRTHCEKASCNYPKMHASTGSSASSGASSSCANHTTRIAYNPANHKPSPTQESSASWIWGNVEKWNLSLIPFPTQSTFHSCPHLLILADCFFLLSPYLKSKQSWQNPSSQTLKSQQQLHIA
jgi:hypothetical protein